MNRKKKLIIYCLIILVYSVCRFFMSSYYFSKDKCEQDILRSLYAEDDIFLMEFPKDSIYTMDLSKDVTKKIYFDPYDRNITFVEIERSGFLYHSPYSYREDELIKNQNDIVSINFELEHEELLLIYRNNPNIYSIELEHMDGSTTISWDWKEDFIGLLLKEDVRYKGTCKAFDEQGNFIAEIEFDR